MSSGNVNEVFGHVKDLPEAERQAAVVEAFGPDRNTPARIEIDGMIQDHVLRRKSDDVTSAVASGANETMPTTPSPPRSGRIGFTPTAPPDHIGEYKIYHEIARGGFGAVYRVRRENDPLGEDLALKLLMEQAEKGAIGRFKREWQMLRVLKHENIARVYDWDMTEDGRPYYVMEHIDGERIDTFCDRERMSLPERLGLFRGVCKAVHHAHKHTIVHRDLKPANIMVSRDGVPKLLDFGIAKDLSPFSPFPGDPTEPGWRVMTRQYASPEQVADAPITTASDVYSLGVILYELLSGHRPYDILSEQDLRFIRELDPENPSTAISHVMEMSDEDPTSDGTHTVTPEDVSRSRATSPDHLRRMLSGDLDNIIRMAMRKEPHRRYESAEELAEDIERHLNGHPVKARPDTWAYRSSKFVKRNRVSVGAAAMIVLSLAGGLAMASAGMKVAREQATIATDRGDTALALIETMVDGVHRRLKQVEGDKGFQLREDVLDIALGNLENLDLDPDPRADLVRTRVLMNLGDLYAGGVESASYGQLDTALDYYNRAQAIIDTIPSDAYPQVVILNRIKLARLYRDTGELDKALQSLDDAERLAVTLPRTDWRFMRRYAAVLSEQAVLLHRTGRNDDAIRKCEESLSVRREAVRLAAKLTGDDDARAKDLTRWSLRVGHFNLAAQLDRAGRFDDAIEQYLLARAITEERLRNDEQNTRTRRSYHNVNVFLAKACLQNEQLDEAEAAIDAAGAIAEQRHERAPSDAQARRDLVLTELIIGEIAEARGSVDQALAAYRRADELIAWFPKDDLSTIVRNYMVETSWKLGRARHKTGNTVKALDDFDAALLQLRELRELAPLDRRWWLLAIEVEADLSAVLLEADGVEAAREPIVRLEEMAADPTVLQKLDVMVVLNDRLSELHASILSNDEQSRRYAEDALAAIEHDGNPRFHRVRKQALVARLGQDG